MKHLITCCLITFCLFACSNNNNDSDTDSHLDSVSNNAVPGNSIVQPNADANVIPNDNQTNANSLDTGRIDSLVGKDSIAGTKKVTPH